MHFCEENLAGFKTLLRMARGRGRAALWLHGTQFQARNDDDKKRPFRKNGSSQTEYYYMYEIEMSKPGIFFVAWLAFYIFVG